jgi:hypothetical protein
MSSGGALPDLFDEQPRVDDFEEFLKRKKGLARGNLQGIAAGDMTGGRTGRPSGPTSGPKTEQTQARWTDVLANLRKPFAAQHRWFGPFQYDDLASLVGKRKRQVHYGFDATRQYSPLRLETDKYAAELWKCLHDALREMTLASSRKARRSAAQDPIDREIEAFERMKPELLLRHEGKHVAVFQGEVRDVDSDMRALARRVYGRFGMVPILIRQVLREEPEPRPLPFPERR